METRIVKCPWCDSTNNVTLGDLEALSIETKLLCLECGKRSIHTSFGASKVYGSSRQQYWCEHISTLNYFLIGFIFLLFIFKIAEGMKIISIIAIVFIFLLSSCISANITGIIKLKGTIYKDLQPKTFDTILGIMSVFTFIIGFVLIYQIYIYFFAEQTA